MNLTLSAPGKTFLVGEYAVLAGGPALVLNTGPRFELRVTRGDTAVVGLPERSPAARWLAARAPLLEGHRLEFHDPYAGAGGLGASGAQFLLVHTFTTLLQQAFAHLIRDGVDLADVFNDYHVLSERQGSGADLLAQAAGQVAVVDMITATARAEPWPYPELGFTLVRTHRKVATHEHLDDLPREKLTLLVRPAGEAVAAFGRAPAEVFVGKVNDFARALAEFDFRAPATANLIAEFGGEPWCLSAKGCGALGADVILILHPSGDHARVRAHLKKLSLPVLATDRELSPGLELKWQ